MGKIFWIASYPKSGNTWMRAILTSLFHTQDGNFNFTLFDKITSFDTIDNYSFVKKIDKEDYNKLNELPILSKYWIKAQNKYKEINNFSFFKTHSSNVILDKNHYTSQSSCNGLIYLIRDPRDVVISYSKHYRQDIDSVINLMNDKNHVFTPHKLDKSINKMLLPYLISSWDIHYKTWLNLDVPKIIIKYESLLIEPKNTINLIINFFKKNYKIQFNDENKIINNILKTTKFENLKDYERKNGFNEASYFFFKKGIAEYFFRKGISGQWQDELKKNQIKKIESNFESTMKELYYL
tara:strand:- start:15740 stop:16624 length:885 start_codon:yes stop_codon:yes gene_type:complete